MRNKGQALITLLFFSVIAINVTAAAVIILMVNTLSGSKLQQGSVAYAVAQAGIENAKLRLLRDPDYTGETDLSVGDGLVDITVSKNGSEYTILSVGEIANFKRQIQMTALYSENLFTFDPQEEVF